MPSRWIRVATCVLTGALIVGVSFAQAQTVRRNDDGRALDANPGLGTGGRNSTVSGGAYAPNYANNYITGNVSGLGRFQGFSPVQDPSQFRAGLGSAGLSFFRRESVSVADVMAGRQAAGLSYYDPSNTIVDVGGILSGWNRPGSSIPGSTTRIARDPDYRPSAVDLMRAGQGLSIDVAAALAADGPRDADELGRILASPLFGTRDAVPESPWAAPGDPRVLSDWRESYDQRMAEVRRQIESVETTGRVVDAPDGPRSAADEPTAQPDARTGRDLFDDWRTALSVLDQTDADYVADLAARRTAGRDETERSAVRADPLISAWLDRAVDPDDPKRQAEFEARRRRMRTIESSARWAARLLDAGVTSLAGSGGDPVNRLLEMGEKEMAARRYYDAARTFQRAASVDARHPLPYIACGHALLAAGDYVAACARLQQGYGLYGRAALLSLDLPALLGDPRVVELRIGDLRTQLQNNEDDQLRFLLGYAQYHSGARADGLLNLIHAARGAPPGSVISLYPDLLIDRGATPSP